MKDITLKRPKVILLAVGGGGLNIAIDLTKSTLDNKIMQLEKE